MRTTETAVKSILARNYDVDRGTELYPFLEAAAVVVDQVVECAAAKDIPVTLSTGEQEIIERWLAAHFYQAGPDLGYSSSSTLQSSGSFQGQTSEGLRATYYGQMAMRLDKSGCLTEIEADATDLEGGPNVASGFWLGTPPSQQTYYRDRN